MTTFEVRTFGCQMNKHDAERVAGMLRDCGMSPVTGDEAPDLLVFLTCCVRENADERLYGQASAAKALKMHSKTMIAVGGCIAQRDGRDLLRELPHVDVVFGTHNLGRLPALLEAAEAGRTPVVEVLDGSTDFASDLPGVREHPWHAWVPITVGCDNYCTYCIVPYVRGPERSRTLEDIVEECERLVADGVVEITLLGQNVNSYGRDLYGAPRFAEVLRRVAGAGAQRIRFATSHPKDLSDETIRAMAEEPAVCKALHLPVQSGSDRILAAMNRHYTQADYLALVGRLQASMSGLALSTDIIVGFPGESEDDFEQTMHVVEAADYDQAFTFIYSPREGTPAATMPGQVPRAVSQVRFDRLVDAVKAGALRKNSLLVGSEQRVLVEGVSKRDPSVIAGRTEGNKVVHAPLPEGVGIERLAGRLVDVHIEEAQTWFLFGRLSGYEPT